MIKSTLVLAGLLALCAGCSREIPPEIRDQLESYFSGRPKPAGWEFVKLTHGFSGRQLVADVLVTQPLPGTPAEQQAQVKSRLCPPPADDVFWNRLGGYGLSVAVYTRDRKFTVLVDCDAPGGAVGSNRP